MRTLHGYLTRQVLGSVLMTVAVFTFVLLLGNVLKEILTLLVNRQATLLAVMEAVALLIPFVLVFALPMGLLTATLLVFGRFSVDSELTAVRASGVSLLSLVTPILLLSVLLSGVCAIINMEVAPLCRVAYKSLLFRIGLQQNATFLPEKTFIRSFKGYILYAGKIDGNELHDLLVYSLDNDGKVFRYQRAPRAELTIDREAHNGSLTLFDSWTVELFEGTRLPVYAGQTTVTFDLPTQTEKKPSLSDMTFPQLLGELHDLEKHMTAPESVGNLSNDELRAQWRRIERGRRRI